MLLLWCILIYCIMHQEKVLYVVWNIFSSSEDLKSHNLNASITPRMTLQFEYCMHHTAVQCTHSYPFTEEETHKA